MANPIVHHLSNWGLELSRYGTVVGTPSIASNKLTLKYNGSDKLTILTPSDSFTFGANRWFPMLSLNSLDYGSGASEAKVLSCGSFELWIVRIDASTYNVRLKNAGTTIGTGSTAFNWGTDYAPRLGKTSGGLATLEYGGSLQVSVADAGSLTNSIIFYGHTSSIDAAKTVTFGIWALTSDDSDQKRPSTSLTGQTFFPNAIGRLDEWPTLVGSATKYGAVSEATADDDTSYISTTAQPQSELFGLPDSSLTNPRGVLMISRARVDIAGKSGTITHLLGDGGNEAESAAMILTIGYANRGTVFHLDPDNADWTDGQMDALQIGGRFATAEVVRARLTAIAAEGIAFALDPVAAATRRRLLHQVIR